MWHMFWKKSKILPIDIAAMKINILIDKSVNRLGKIKQSFLSSMNKRAIVIFSNTQMYTVQTDEYPGIVNLIYIN